MNKHDRRKPPIGLWSAIDELELIPVGGACGDRFDRADFFRNRHGRDRGQFAGAIAPRGIRGGCIRSGAGLHCLFEVGTLLITEGRPAPHLLPQRLRTLPVDLLREGGKVEAQDEENSEEEGEGLHEIFGGLRGSTRTKECRKGPTRFRSRACAGAIPSVKKPSNQRRVAEIAVFPEALAEIMTAHRSLTFDLIE